MRKAYTFIFSILSSFVCLLLISPKPVSAEGEFKTYLNVEYAVNEKGTTTVIQHITLENVFSTLYATSYSITLQGVKVNNPRASQDGRALKVEKTDNSGAVTIKVDFDDSVVGQGKRRVFDVSFDDDTIVTKTGEVWEVLVPKINSDTSYESYSVTLDIPKSFGNAAYMSPDPSTTNFLGNTNQYIFNGDVAAKNGVSAAFGQFQVFDFNLVYHLENPLARVASIEIAIPPDSAFQKVNYKGITPAPSEVRIDADGNWLAKYDLKPRERVDVTATGAVQLFASGRNFPRPTQSTLSSNLKPSDFWQITDPEIVSLAKRLKTPRAIYDYVSLTLSYDYSRVQPNVTRLGAIAALADPKSAICTEFTDLFIAIARAAGIPAREVNGYAYTENPQIQPISLVADVLHAWPEYWDSKNNIWVPVDPTWGSTTGGIDFYSKLDLRHFAFVVHGEDSTKPYPPGSYKLGANPQKDVFVSFGKLPEKRTSVSQINTKTTGGILFLGLKVNAQVVNPGPVGLYDQDVKIYFDNTLYKQFKLDQLPVYGKYNFDINVPYGFFGHGTPDRVVIVVGNSSTEVLTHKTNFIIANASIVLIVIFGLTTLTYFRIRKYLLKRKGK